MRGLYNFISRAALLSLATAAGSSRVTTKSIVTKDGYTYVYDHVAPHNASMPTILLLHGYPASRYHWHHQIQPLSDAGFGIIAPDSLGYGDSSKPTAVEAYVFRDMADHVAEILDAEGLADVVGVGHDWGSGVLSRSAVFHPERFSKLVFMSAGYFAPGTFFDVDAINAEGLESLGYTPFGYWYFFPRRRPPPTAGVLLPPLLRDQRVRVGRGLRAPDRSAAVARGEPDDGAAGLAVRGGQGGLAARVRRAGRGGGVAELLPGADARGAGRAGGRDHGRAAYASRAGAGRRRSASSRAPATG